MCVEHLVCNLLRIKVWVSKLKIESYLIMSKNLTIVNKDFKDEQQDFFILKIKCDTKLPGICTIFTVIGRHLYFK